MANQLEEATKKWINKRTIGRTLLLSLPFACFGRIFFFILLAGLAIIIVSRIRLSGAHRAVRREREEVQSRRGVLWGEHQQKVQRWNDRVAEIEEQQNLAYMEADAWFPVRLQSSPTRIDVFGGTDVGWINLIATVGGPLLRSGQAMIVTDFSQQGVATELMRLASHVNVPVEYVTLPVNSAANDLLDGFTAEELAECLAEALHSMRSEGADSDLRSLDADLIQTALQALEGPVTYARLAAGLRVLLRVHEPVGTDQVPLTSDEVEALTRAIDLVGSGERVQNALRNLRGLMELMAKAPERADAGHDSARWWVPGQLTVLATYDLIDRRKELTDRIVFFRLLHLMRSRRLAAGTGMIVIAGADQIRRAALESMTRQAQSSGIRLTLLFEHLRDDAAKFAGGLASATVFMRLGNGQEARDAAHFIGQDYKFLVNQLTKQTGETRTESFSATRSEYSEGNHSSSDAYSETRGETLSRVYEFTVEPTQLQSLAPTAILLVESGPRGRQATFADCNPNIAGLPTCSSTPRPALD